MKNSGEIPDMHKKILEVFELLRSAFGWFILEVHYSYWEGREPNISFRAKKTNLSREGLERLLREAEKRNIEIHLTGDDDEGFIIIELYWRDSNER